jgi:SAM-dependent methyltransferase
VLEAARRAGGTGIRFVEADAARMPFEESSFDTVVGLEVLEHLTVDAAEDFVSECARVLRPAGSLIVVTPNRYFRMMPGQRPINPEHTRELTEKQVRALLASRFGEVRTMGTRATDYLEEVEKHRIGRSARRAYIVGPAGRFVRRHAPGLASKLKPPPPEVDLDIFLSDAPRVEAGDFRLEEPAGKRAMEVVAVARKVP